MRDRVELESSMTGSTSAGPLKPPVDNIYSPIKKFIDSSSSGQLRMNNEATILQSSRRSIHDKMTPVRPQSGQPIQLTPLWEHVVRTRRFPPEVDTRETFDEITERLRDPEWEVRQHALRVLVDVLPTLDNAIIDDSMKTVLPELVNNLGHVAPAVRKGALDTLRVYLACSLKRDDIVTGILNDGLIHQETRDDYPTNIILGLILSTPSLLFPSPSGLPPSDETIRRAIGALANRLVQVTHQEASLRSLVKIHELLGDEKFDLYMSEEMGDNAKRDYEILCNIYDIKPSGERNLRKKSGRVGKRERHEVSDRSKIKDPESQDSRLIGMKNNEFEDETVRAEENNASIQGSKIVLETEIKLNDATAITMTIIERNDDDNDLESDLIISDEITNNVDEKIAKIDRDEDARDIDLDDEWIERRKTPRRVHFGGEIVKLRTPDSDDSDPVKIEISQTRIPIPVLSPTTRITSVRSRKTRSNPCSPSIARSAIRSRKTKSLSNSPRREFYIHDGTLSPKKSILARSTRDYSSGRAASIETFDGKNKIESRVDMIFGEREIDDGGWAFEICDNDTTFDDSPFARIDRTKDYRYGREITARKVKSARTNDKIGNIRTKKSASPRKKRNPTKPMNDKAKSNGEIAKIEISASLTIENTENFNNANRSSTRVASIGELTSKDRQFTGEKIVEASSRDNDREASKVEMAEKSVAMPENFSQTLPKEKCESIEEPRGRVVEKFESTNENDFESSSIDLSLRAASSSPRSSKNLIAYETFPRKERNYILMELTSPAKTSARRTSESATNDDENEKNRDTIMANDAPLSGETSTIGKSIDQDRDEKLENHEISNVSRVDDPIFGQSSEKNDENKMAAEANEAIERTENFEACPLNDIVIAETTRFRESNWEDLGLVDQEVLNDLHNKDDWRARVRGLERVASALRTSSALIAIEPRLGSLLQAVLGGERSCRVAAAGMAVARVVVAGVSEEALKRRLPQVAWGLARQGGPNAAQLARVAMLRLRPALLLEQILQPHCIKARNAKTRENALQLLIFSLVTFPSTEFKVENVAYKVACMVGDRRRRVRQAALDTLAVLAQIYEPEEVMKAGKLASKDQQDGDGMLAAIKSRLARKSLPMVSADGLVLYGLQISPTVQIATGPDVDWIVAGSGSVSPGTGRTRGQIIATTTRQTVQEKNSRNESTKNAPRVPNFIAHGVGLGTKNEYKRPLAWQIVQHSAQDTTHRTREKSSNDRSDENFIGDKDISTKSSSGTTGRPRQYRSAIERHEDSIESNIVANPTFLINDKDVIMKQRKTEENFHRRMDEIYAERIGIAPISQDAMSNRLESRIPVAQARDRDASERDSARNVGIHPRIGLSREGNNLQNWSASSRVSDGSRLRSTQRDDNPQTDNDSPRYLRDSSTRRFSPRRDDYYGSMYRHSRGFADGNVYREVQTAPTTTSYDVTRRRQSLKDSTTSRYAKESRLATSDESSQTGTTMTMSNHAKTRTRRHEDSCSGHENSKFRNRDKSTIEDDDTYNEVNRRNFSAQANPYEIQDTNDRASQCQAPMNNEIVETSSNDSSNVSCDDEGSGILEKIHNERNCDGAIFYDEKNENNAAAIIDGTNVEKSFDVITHETNPSRRNSIDYGISSRNVHSSNLARTAELENDDFETDKDSSIDEISMIPRITMTNDENIADNDDYENESSEFDETSNVNDRNMTIENFSDDVVSKLSENSSSISNESDETEVANSKISKSPARIDSLLAIRSIEAVDFEDSSPNTDDIDGSEITTVSYVRECSPADKRLENEPRAISPPRVDDDIVGTFVKTEIFLRRSRERLDSLDREENTISILVEASRPSSHDSRNNRDEDKISIESHGSRRSSGPAGNNFNERLVESIDKSIMSLVKVSNDVATTRTNVSRDSTNLVKIDDSSNTGNEIAIISPKVNDNEASTSEKSQGQKKVAVSRVSRMRLKTRTNVARVAPMQPIVRINERNASKTKTLIQQCLTQLESNDWEITIKGLKGLSEIARQEPEQLDYCPAGIVGRLLGRHVRNLRSQVSRAACHAAGDVFRSQARCIDQDLDDIAGSLLHRTADTNKFLRADSNEALDLMVENLSPNRTIMVIVHRGGTHQNPIVRATTARLLASIVDRVGPDWTMSMSRDVREKLIATGAKLLMDGNLDARNHSKRMFRKLSRCEGFRKVLKDSVPETTLRHIDKTLRSL